jgi:DNA-binding NtrC family response regulator
MFLHEWNVLKNGRLLGRGLPRHAELRPPEGSSGKGQGLENEFSTELFEIVARNVRLGRPICLKAVTRQFEREIITYVLGVTRWNQKKTAEILGIKQTTLNYWVHQFGLAPGRRGAAHMRARDSASPDAGKLKDGIPPA